MHAAFYEVSYLLNQISEKTGISDDLKACFGGAAEEILSIAYNLVIEEGQPMYRFSKWGYTHWNPYKGELSSQQISEIFIGITEDKKQEFFRRQAKRRSGNEYLAFDTTSISSYSELIRQVKYGKTRRRR